MPALIRATTRHSARRDAFLSVVALLLLVVWDLGGLDLPLARLYGSAQGFVWRNHWLTGAVLHDGARAVGWVVFGVLLLGLRWPLPFLRGLSPRERVWWLVTMLVCVALIPLIRQTSTTSCPWSLAEFGGSASYVSHWLPGARDGGPGRCFPSGHASAAFSFLAGWFALRERAPRAARAWLIVTLAAGLGLGWVQMMRGAHYLGHSMWTAWVCWSVATLSWHVTRSWRENGRRPGADAGPGFATAPMIVVPSPSRTGRSGEAPLSSDRTPAAMRLLLIEDDTMIGTAVLHGLNQAGFAVDWVTDGRAAELSLANGVYDLAILDLGLPRKDGMAILAALRAVGNAMPVLIASARDTVRDRIAGLEAGADDYVLKPFDLDELVARVRALLRRHAGSGSPLLRFGPLVLDPVGRTVTRDGDAVDLSAREFAVLEALMQRPGAVLSREKLEESVYGWGDEIGSNAIEVHLHHLRKKLGAAVIKNVRGVGYRVTAG